MAKTKLFFGEQVLLELQNEFRNSDEKIDIREAILRIDAIVNLYAEKNYFDNWKLRRSGLDEHYVTTWDSVTVTDPTGGHLSHLTLPSHYCDLPNNEGIVEIFPKRYYERGNNHSVVVMSHQDWRTYNSTMAASMQGRLFGFPKGRVFTFNKANVGKQYGDMGVRLAVKDSSMLSDTDIYPIPANKEHLIIQETVKWFRERRTQPSDAARDGVDKP